MLNLLGLIARKDPTILLLMALDLYALCVGVVWLIRKLGQPQWRKTLHAITFDANLQWMNCGPAPIGICDGCLGVKNRLIGSDGEFWHCPACGRIEDITPN